MNIAIIGAGNVGAHIASGIIHKNLPVTLHLCDAQESFEAAQVLDLKDTLLFSPRTKVVGADFGDDALRMCDVFIITAGAKQEDGEDRCALVSRNIEILRDIRSKMGDINEKALIIMVTNPVDALTFAAHRIFGLPRTQVFGTGTLLDTARLRWRLARHLGKGISDVDGYVLGEHGDSECVAWSSVSGSEEISEHEKKNIAHATMHQAYDIISGKGATFFGIGAATAEIVECIFADKGDIMPLSCILDGEYGLKDVSFGVPAQVGRKGVKKIVELQLAQEETQALQFSADKIKKIITQCIP